MILTTRRRERTDAGSGIDPARTLTVKVNGKTVRSGVIAIDPATLLAEARRTGDRQRPTVARIEVRF